jgi:hypothetical protein
MPSKSRQLKEKWNETIEDGQTGGWRHARHLQTELTWKDSAPSPVIHIYKAVYKGRTVRWE